MANGEKYYTYLNEQDYFLRPEDRQIHPLG